MKKRLFSLVAVLSVIMSICCTRAYNTSIALSDGLNYYEKYVTADNGGFQTHVIEYTKSDSVTPIVVYGSKLYGRSTIGELKKYVENNNIESLAAINGDFFALSTGIPEGLTVTEGVMRSSDSYQNAMGITMDGTVFFGTPQLRMDLKRNDNYTVSVTYFNKTRTNQGVYLLNSDFSSETRITSDGINILLKKLDGNQVKIGGEVRLVVESIYETGTSEKIQDGYMVLTVDKTGPIDKISELKMGDELVFSVTSGDTRWNNAEYAVGAGDYLLKNSEVQKGLSSTKKPCTAVGIKSGGGSCVFIAVDGRQVGSDGISPKSLAEYLKSMGCTEALILDGGGSTTSAVNYIGTQYLTVTNSPSDGAQRKCANYIMFRNDLPKTGELSSMHIYASNEYALPGAEVALVSGGADSGRHYVYLSGTPTYFSQSGTISDSTYIAPILPGKYTVSAAYNGLTAYDEVEVVDHVDRIEVSESTIIAKPLEKIELIATAFLNNREVASKNSSFTWKCENVGAVDENGCFTATRALSRTGSIKVSYGDKSVDIKVLVSSASPFDTPLQPFLPLK